MRLMPEVRRNFLRRGLITLVEVSSLLAACTSPIFPDWALQERSLQAWRAPHDLGTVPKGTSVLVGGLIVEVQHQDDYLILARQLPLKENLALGPLDTVRAGQLYAVLFGGSLDERALDWRNKFIVDGEMVGMDSVPSGGITRSLAVIQARCLHIWRTQTFSISEFPYLPTGYSTLRHDTYCSTPLARLKDRPTTTDH